MLSGSARERFEDWIYGQGPPFPANVFLYVLSLFYGGAVRLRLFLYGRGILSKKRLPCPVVSIGNITVGGTGKTPVCMAVAGFLEKEGLRVAVLSRGYGGSAKGPAVVSDGRRIFLGPDEAGDEPCMMARRLEGVPVVVGRDRFRAGLLAVERFRPDVVVLDDGFQHIGLARDLDVLCVDRGRGFGGGRLLPLGILREPIDGIKRAHILLIKGRGAVDIPCKIDVPVFGFTLRPLYITDLRHGTREEIELVKGKRVLALSGIAGPDSFVNTIKELGAETIKAITYPDHHVFTRKDMEEIKRCSRGMDMVLTTEKDAVRLEGFLRDTDLEIYALIVEALIDDGFFSRVRASFMEAL